MKKVMLFSVLHIAFILNTLAQKATIKSDRAKFHIGESVTVIDSITSVVVKNDSTTIIKMGSKNNLTVILKLPVSKTDNSLKGVLCSLLEVKGKLDLMGEQPVITVSSKDSLYFFSPIVKQQWVLSSEQTVRKFR
jgi:hypothetical protein